jgi:hypothetical protein
VFGRILFGPQRCGQLASALKIVHYYSCYSFSPASTVMRHAFVLASALDGTRVGNENLKKLLD